MVLRHGLTLVILSALLILFLPQFHRFINDFAFLHSVISKKMSIIFAGDDVGHLITHVLALLVIPLVAGIIPAAVYFLLKHEPLPYTLHIVWITWIVLATFLALRAHHLSVAVPNQDPAAQQQVDGSQDNTQNSGAPATQARVNNNKTLAQSNTYGRY